MKRVLSATAPFGLCSLLFCSLLSCSLLSCSFLFAQGEPDLQSLQLEEGVFIYKSADAKVVSVVGDFNGWNHTVNPMTRRGTDNNWSVVVRLRKGKVYEYGFCVDGAIVADPDNPIRTANGRYSIYYAPGAAEKDAAGSIDISDPKAIPAMFRRLEERLSFLSQTVSAMSQQFVKQNDTLLRKDVQLEEIRRECEKLRLENLTLGRDLVVEKAKVEDLNSRYSELKTESLPMADRLREAEKTAEESKRAARDRDKTLNDALQAKLATEQKLKDAEAKLATLEKSLLDAQSKQAETAKPPADTEPKPPAAGTEAVTTPPAGTDVDGAAPSGEGKVHGKIVVISPRSNLLALDVGKLQGIASGDEFLVVREGKIVGKLAVESIDGDTLSLARVLAPYKKDDLKQGDAVQSVK